MVGLVACRGQSLTEAAVLTLKIQSPAELLKHCSPQRANVYNLTETIHAQALGVGSWADARWRT